VYDTVYEAQSAAMALVKPSNSFSQCTAAANSAIIEGLLKLRILQDGTVEELLAARMHSVFMPHGLGHSVGLDVHDPGSTSPFAAGMVITIEPGVYFIDALIDAALASTTQSKYLNEEVLDTFRGMGGVRIEDTLLVTIDGYDNLSAKIPRSAADVERWMRDGVASPQEVAME
jgi:Xaa-Pro dipeptidase